MANVPIKWAAPTVAYTSYLTTTLNALANNTTDLGAEINNETNLCTYMDLELYLASLDLSAQSSPSVVIYLLESIDGGTHFDTGEDGVSAETDMPPADKILTQFGLRINTGAEVKHAIKSIIPIPPGRFKLLLRNKTGVAFAGTLNTLYYRTYNLRAVTA